MTTTLKFTFILFSLAFFVACQSNSDQQQNNNSTVLPIQKKTVELSANPVKEKTEVVSNKEPDNDNASDVKSVNKDAVNVKTVALKSDNANKEVKKTILEKEKTHSSSADKKKDIKQENPPKVENIPLSSNPEVPVVEDVKEVVKPQKETPGTSTVPKVEVVEKTKPSPPVINHDDFDDLLRAHVSSAGKVNYNNFKADEAKLDAYLKQLEENPIETSWSRSKKMAYWINAYNAFTIKLILKNYPVSSITKLHNGKPWDVKWIKLGNKTYSLNNIENDILRPQYKDARIHFAVNCAAKSCPPLLNRAWTASNLNKYLEKQTKSFINDKVQNSISSNSIEISKIFEWYAADFGNIVDYLNKYSDSKIDANAKVSYKEYNWDLNK